MNVITPGYKYELDHFENHGQPGRPVQTLQFIEKRPVDNSTILETVNNGTTNEEVLEVMIHRMKFLQAKFPCQENEFVIASLQQSLTWLNKRTADRAARGVEGKQVV